MKRNWFDTKILILGFSKSGIASARYLNSRGANCFITEAKLQKETDSDLINELKNLGIEIEFGGHSDDFMSDVYMAITSPGIPPHSDIVSRLKELNIPVISEVELAYLEATVPFIAITGTNGKTTTTSLTSHILSAQYNAPVCGNIGIPPVSLLNAEKDYLVCELSSFQIEYSPSFKAQIAMFLNFTPDHIDWHGGLDNYFKAKAKIFSNSQAPAFAIFNALDEKLLEFSTSVNSEVFYFGKEFEKNCCFIKDGAIYFKRSVTEKIIDLVDVPLVGEHNYQNVMASVISAKLVGISNEQINDAIKSFKAVEHRCEYVANLGDIAFYNDSKATNPEASIVAIQSFPNKRVTLIAGGRDKMTSLDEFVKSINSCINDVILIGEASNRFNEALVASGYSSIEFVDTLEHAVDRAIEISNEVVLLSPACASYDMFDNYEVRGTVFKEYVKSKI